MVNVDLEGKTAMVTGGTIGIGAAAAMALARSGVDVALTYLSHPAQDVVTQIRALGRQAATFHLDATDSGAVNQIVAEAVQQLGGHVDILVNNAGGLVRRQSVAKMDDTHWHEVMDLNLSSAFYVTRAVLPHMNTGWGRIINIASLAGENGGGPGAVAYAAAKAGMIGFTRGLAKEVAGRGITVNAVAPGLILGTPFHLRHTPPDAQQATIASTPLRRPGYPDDVAGAVLYLASDLAAFVTGDTIDVNGGTWF